MPFAEGNGGLIWLMVALAFGLIEVFTVGFFFCLFSVGALVAAAITLFTTNLWVQIAGFLLASLLSILFLRPLLKNAFQVGSKPLVESNVQALIGARALVLEPVGKYRGKVKLLQTGEVWSAYLQTAEDDAQSTLSESTEVPKNTEVIVAAIDGAKLVIRQA